MNEFIIQHLGNFLVWLISEPLHAVYFLFVLLFCFLVLSWEGTIWKRKEKSR